jgi:hypothetical protein
VTLVGLLAHEKLERKDVNGFLSPLRLAVRGSLTFGQFVQKPLRRDEIRRVEPLGEPVVNGGKFLSSLVAPPLGQPQAAQAERDT